MNNKLFLKYLIFLILSIHFLFSFIIDHNPATVVNFNESLNIQMFTDFPSENIRKAELYLKTDNQIAYLKIDINKTSDNYYETVVPAEFIMGDYLEYYILVELIDGNYRTIPENDPHINPFFIKIIKNNPIEETQNLLQADFEIIAPKVNQKLKSNDVIISLSYFKVKDLDVSKIKVFIDEIDKTSSAVIRKNNLFMIPRGLSDGKHTVKVHLENNNGVKFNPIVWNFYIEDGEDLFSNMSYSGKLLNSYTNNELDGNIISTNISNLYLDLKSDLFDINSKFRKSSLENDLSQPHDRYYVKLNISESFHIQYGDFYPRFNNFILNGNRVRGMGLDFESDFFQIKLIKGNLDRAVQGDAYNGSSIISDYYACEDENFCDNMIDISRNNYTFEKELYGLRIAVGRKDRLNFAFNILKVEDNINSIDESLDDTIIDIPYDMEPFNEFNSTECIDINDDGLCNSGDDLKIDYDLDGNVEYSFLDEEYEIEESYPCTGYDEAIKNTLFLSTIQCPPEDDWCNEGEIYNHIQEVWEVKVSDEGNNLQNFINSCTFDGLISINVNHLSDNWSGNKPKDNLSLGTDFYFASKNNNLKLKSSFALSLINNNTWDPIMTTAELDTLYDNYLDCYIDRTYVSVENVDYWENCEAYSNSSPDPIDLVQVKSGFSLNNIPHDFKPENLEKYYHWNTGSVPLIPFFPILQKLEGSCNLGMCRGELLSKEVCEEYNDILYTNDLLNAVNIDSCTDINGDWVDNECEYLWKEIDNSTECSNLGGIWDDEITLKEVLNQAEVAYDIDLSLSVKKHQLQFGVKKVGSQFNSLGNPYIQKDLIESYFIDRIRLLNNKLYLSFKLKNIKTGILEGTNSFETDKVDLNINYYPGINLPSVSLSIGSQYRKGGADGQNWLDFLAQCDSNNDGDIDSNDTFNCYEDWIVLDENTNGNIEIGEFQTLPDTRSKTRTDHYNFGYNQSVMFKRKQNISYNYYHSTKQDLLYNELNETLEFYISPRSKNSSSNLNITTYYSNNFNSKIFYSNSSYNYAQKTSDYYLRQIINRIGGGFSYQNNSYIDKIGAELTYSDATGTSKYNQIGLKLFARLILLEELNMNLSYKYLNKKFSEEKYHNNIFKINLSYRF